MLVSFNKTDVLSIIVIQHINISVQLLLVHLVSTLQTVKVTKLTTSHQILLQTQLKIQNSTSFISM